MTNGQRWQVAQHTRQAGKRVIQIRCALCGTQYVFTVEEKDYQAWQNGELIQRAMPYLTANQRELLISQTCDRCFEGLFKEVSEE